MKYVIIGNIAPHIKLLKDVTVQGQEICFGKSWTKKTAEKTLTHAATGELEKVFKVSVKKKELTAELKTLILSKISGKIAERIDEFGVYEYRASTDQKDTDNDIFDKSMLDMMVIDGNSGLPFIWRHDYENPLGRVFSAKTVRNEEKLRWELLSDVYVLPDATVGSSSLKAIDVIDAGIYDNCSVRVRTGMPKVIAGENYDNIYIYSADALVSWKELSLVPYGANESATRIKEKSNIQFQLIEDMEILNVELEHLKGAKTDITVDLVKSMSKEIHTYRENLATERQTRVDLFMNKSLTIDPKADKDDLEILAKGLTDEKLSAKIQTLTEKEAALKNGLNPENKETEKAKTLVTPNNYYN